MKIVFVIIGMFVVVSNAAADNCNSLIQHGLYNEVRKSSAVDSYQEVVNNICKDYSSFKSDEKSGNVKATYGAFGGKAGFSASTYEKLSKSMCSESGSIDKLAKNRDVLEKIISPEAIDAYKTCQSLNAKGLKVDTKISAKGDHISVSLHYATVGTNGNEIEIQQPYITDSEQFKCGGSLKPNSKLPVNTNVEYHCSRKVTGKEGDIFIYKGRRMYANSATLTIPTSVASIYREIPAVYAKQIPSPLKGAVVSFESKSCPNGWEFYRKISGRTIIGAGDGKGLTKRVLGQKGGTEMHILSVSEMPKHSHKIAGGTEYEGPESGRTQSFNQANQWQGESSPAGSGKPHNNVPPYLVLTYCKKL